MRGRTLLIFVGTILSLGSASGPIGAKESIAQQRRDASAEMARASAQIPYVWTGRFANTPGLVPTLNTNIQTITFPKKSVAVAPQSRQTLLPVVDQPDILQKQKVIADEVLRMLPESCQTSLKDFYVRYDKPERRGLAGKSVVIMDGTLGDDEFRSVLIHEALGHFMDLGCLTGSPRSGASPFKDGDEIIYNNDASVNFYAISWANSTQQKKGIRSADFVSGYAAYDPFEDLAESVCYYFLHQNDFRIRAASNAALAAKMRWIETVAFPGVRTFASAQNTWDGVVPWDTTKLPYTWLAAPTLASR